MPFSRLRLRLASRFALAFALGLAVLATGALGFLWRESNRRLDARLDGVASGLAIAVERELRETPDSSLTYVAQEVAAEWPRNGDAFVIADSARDTLATVGDSADVRRVLDAFRARPAARLILDDNGPDLRASTRIVTIGKRIGTAREIAILSYGSSEGIESDTQLLGVALAIAAPLILLISLAAGYMMARGALKPIGELQANIASIAPTDLARRIPVHTARDEVTQLADEFNSLLARLDASQSRNRGFVRETAHQIRTPLTLVLGEAAHELAASDADAVRTQATLVRIRSAAEHMRRRVDELFLRAEAEAGETVLLEDRVELDEVLLDCTDLMRARAKALGRALAIDRAEPVTIRGNAALVREAVLELLENACRHGTAETPVTISCRVSERGAEIEVTNSGDALRLPTPETAAPRSGVGLAIVRWVAESHGGQLFVTRDGTLNRTTITLGVASE